MIDREEFINELKLREFIRKAIRVVNERKLQKSKKELMEEKKLRKVIRELILEADIADPEDTPHDSTGIQYLRQLLKKIIPVLEDDFKLLTTSSDQRNSYRAHIVKAVQNSIAPPRVTDLAGKEGSSAFISINEEAGDLTVSVDQDEIPEEFIDIEQDEKTDDERERESMSISGEDETGRDAAFETFKKIESNIVSTWQLLHNEEDKNLFYDYLLTNLKLYFDNFEDDLQEKVPEPTTSQYEQEKQTQEPAQFEKGVEELGL